MLRAVLLLTTLACLPPCPAAAEPGRASLRIATFNIAMGLEAPGELSAALSSGADRRSLASTSLIAPWRSWTKPFASIRTRRRHS